MIKNKHILVDSFDTRNDGTEVLLYLKNEGLSGILVENEETHKFDLCILQGTPKNDLEYKLDDLKFLGYTKSKICY